MSTVRCMTQPAPTGDEWGEAGLNNFSAIHWVIIITPWCHQWIKYSLHEKWRFVDITFFWIGFKHTSTHFPSKPFVSPYTLYDGKLGNNSSFAQCFGRAILHNYPTYYRHWYMIRNYKCTIKSRTFSTHDTVTNQNKQNKHQHRIYTLS